MNQTEKEKITRFLNDDIMQSSIYTVLLETFLKPKDRTDIHMLAASRIAIDLLEEAWKELQKHKRDIQEERKEQVVNYL